MKIDEDHPSCTIWEYERKGKSKGGEGGGDDGESFRKQIK